MRFVRPARSEQTPVDRDTPTEKLLAAAAAGDEQAFAHLYDQTSARVYGLVLRVLRDDAQAAEVTQDVYVQIWRESARFEPGRGSAMSWMLTIAHRRAVDRARASEATRQRDDRYATRETDRSYDQVSEQAQSNIEATSVREALSALTDIQRDAVRLAYFEGYTYREVAALLNIPLGTAKTRIRDGLARLRDAMGDRDDA